MAYKTTTYLTIEWPEEMKFAEICEFVRTFETAIAGIATTIKLLQPDLQVEAARTIDGGPPQCSTGTTGASGSSSPAG